ncbi:MAG: STAS domain-containing protein [Verrucomicrobia bacterium]|nr:STAS domain-containing protein [Verrucomicrobiota bacterium]
MATRALIIEFKLQQITEGEVQILSFSGYMGNPEFSQDRVLSRLLEQERDRVILDLTTLSFTTTVSLARFLVCGCEFRQHGGELKLAGLSPWLGRLAEMAGFDSEKDCEPDVATALKKMSQLPNVKPRRLPNKK